MIIVSQSLFLLYYKFLRLKFPEVQIYYAENSHGKKSHSCHREVFDKGGLHRKQPICWLVFYLVTVTRVEMTDSSAYAVGRPL